MYMCLFQLFLLCRCHKNEPSSPLSPDDKGNKSSLHNFILSEKTGRRVAIEVVIFVFGVLCLGMMAALTAN